jgi:glycosyltransferase involved in cell wall biosynthesis
VRLRARHLLDSYKLFLRRPPDALVIHALETYPLYGVWHRLWRMKTVIVVNPDDSFKSQGRISRWMLDRAVERTALFVPFSNYTAVRMIEMHPEIAGRLIPMHPGLPLDRWPMRTPPERGERFRLLFVGSAIILKGIDALLAAYDAELHTTCDLDVATQTGYLPDDLRARLESTPGVRLHLDLEPGSAELQRLFNEADAFVLPTRGDLSSWVALESLATGVPVVISGVGGIPDIVRDGETGLLIRPDEPDDIVTAVRRLESSPELVDRLVRQGREHVETSFDVQVNTTVLLDLAKAMVDQREAHENAGSLGSTVTAAHHAGA